jgi:hypothetical protein
MGRATLAPAHLRYRGGLNQYVGVFRKGRVYGELKIMKLSTSTRVALDEAFFVPSTFTSRVCATDGSRFFCVNTSLRACVVELYRSTLFVFTPSTHASACPRLVPLGATHPRLSTLLKVSLAVAPETLAYLRLPPEALLKVSVFQVPL